MSTSEESVLRTSVHSSQRAAIQSSLLAEIQKVIDEPSLENSRVLECSPDWGQWLARLTAREASNGDENIPPQVSGSVEAHVGRFLLKSILGCGAFGVVFRARDPNLDRDVALKVLRPEAAISPKLVRRFLSEAKWAGRLEHPGILSVYEASQYAGINFLAAPLCEGPDLATWLEAHPRELTAVQIATLMAEVAGAVHHAHLRGVLHRDLKPSNILLKPISENSSLPYHALLTDFGLACQLDADEQDNTHFAILGTPAYMSPEQAAGQWNDISVASDVFSLGVILYELLTGERPFRGPTVEVLRQATLTETPRSPCTLRPGVPRDLEIICLKCLAKEPSERYGSAGELSADLQRYLRHEPITARSPALSRRVWLWCRRRPIIAGLAGLLAASLLLGLTTTTILYRQERYARTLAEAARDHALAAETATAKQRDRAFAAEAAANEAQATAKATSDFLLDDMLQHSTFAQSSNGYIPIRNLTLKTIVNRAAAKIDERFRDRPRVEARLRDALGAIYLLSLRDNEKALVHFERAVDLDRAYEPDDAVIATQAMSRLAVTYEVLGRYDEAEKIRRTAFDYAQRRLGTKNPATHDSAATLVRFYQTLRKNNDEAARYTSWKAENPVAVSQLGSAAAKLMKEGQWESADYLYQAQFERFKAAYGLQSPRTLEVLSNKGANFAKAGKLNEAEAAYREFLDIATRFRGPYFQNKSAVLFNLATVLERRGDKEQAAACRRESKRIMDVSNYGILPPTQWSENVSDLLAKATTLRLQGALEQAITLYSHILLKEPECAHAFEGRGAAKMALRDYDEAIDDFDVAIDLGLETSSNYLARGSCWEHKHEFRLALADYIQADRFDPRDSNIRYRLANIYRLCGDLESAHDAFNRVVSLKTQSAAQFENGYIGRGRTRFQLGEFVSAESDFKKALAINTKSYDALQGLAWLEATCPDARYRDGDLAIAHASEACELTNWSDPTVLRTLAAANAEAGNFAEAVHWQQQVLGIWRNEAPDDARIQLDLYRRHQPYRDEIASGPSRIAAAESAN